ncbi:hypothetical protein HF325_004775 [Metschnikowia pulcherrima]|uniref:Uncharacterized protein n=1 Tax=Metschnikowia pulcherrima TaxID=27326 RepID=A0A8H7L8T3_9ASCO|nr:hypothetical protein HF325_004775 [Metschnikowia pulcherrima]
MEYTPSDFEHVSKVAASVSKSFHPHSEVVKLLSSNFEATMNQSDHLLKDFHQICSPWVAKLSERKFASIFPLREI